MEKITLICRIRENSWLARAAARKLRCHRVAMVLGRTIHLYGASRNEFLADDAWLRHEAAHLKQYREYGYFGFLWRYFQEYLRSGYYMNRFEVAARAAEQDPAILNGIEIA